MSAELSETDCIQLAEACRIMAQNLLVEDILGHISIRVGDLVGCRCRGPAERGLSFTTAADIHLVDPVGRSVIGDTGTDFSPPNELPIHSAIYGARPDVNCVVHAHPPAVVAASIAGFDLSPIYGAYDIPAAHMARRGIPTHPSSELISDDERSGRMVASLGDADVLILRGHGLVTTGATLPEAVLAALRVDRLARMHLQVRSVGVIPEPLSDEEFEYLPDLGPSFNETVLWNHYRARLAEKEGARHG